MPLPPVSENKPLSRILDRWKTRWDGYSTKERAKITREGFEAMDRARARGRGTGVTGGIPGRWDLVTKPRRGR